jgi:hypothetical protein
MIEPAIAPRVEQRDDLPCNRIDAGQVRALAEIAAVTGEGQITRIIAPTVLARYYVLDVMGKRADLLRKETIFATVSDPASDERPSLQLHR